MHFDSSQIRANPRHPRSSYFQKPGRFRATLLLSLLLTSIAHPARSAESEAALRQQAQAALRKATQYYHDQVALRGGYVYYYSPDLRLRYGEGPATATQIWVQPPG